jgi:hypothetical protein
MKILIFLLTSNSVTAAAASVATMRSLMMEERRRRRLIYKSALPQHSPAPAARQRPILFLQILFYLTLINYAAASATCRPATI